MNDVAGFAGGKEVSPATLLSPRCYTLDQVMRDIPTWFNKRCIQDGRAVPSMTERSHTMARTTKTKATEAVAEAKPKKPSAADQGIPAVYLGENGNFRPGFDAKLKSDLITAVLGTGVLHVFNEKDALKVIEERGWGDMLEKSRTARARKSA